MSREDQRSADSAGSRTADFLRNPVVVGLAALGFVVAAFEVAGVTTMLLAKLVLIGGVWVFATVEVWCSRWIKKTGRYGSSIVLLSCFLSGLISVRIMTVIARLRVEQSQEQQAKNGPGGEANTPTTTLARTPKETPVPPRPKQLFTESGPFFVLAGSNDYKISEGSSQQRPSEIHLYGESPAVIKAYVEDGKIYVDALLDVGIGKKPLRLVHNDLRDRPPRWDRNFDGSAIEIVDENLVPRFQLIYKDKLTAQLCGVFRFGDRAAVINSQNVHYFQNSYENAVDIHRVFEYPSRLHLGVELQGEGAPMSGPMGPSTAPRPKQLTLVFKSSPLFTPERKERIAAGMESFYTYLSQLGLIAPKEIPPIGIGTGAGGTYRSVFSYPGTVYLDSVIIPEKAVDDSMAPVRAYAMYCFPFLIHANDITKAGWTRRGMAGWIFEAYFISSFAGKRPASGESDVSNWVSALWDIRQLYGQEFTDTATALALKAFNDFGDAGDNLKLDLNTYFRNSFLLGEGAVDNELTRLKEVNNILDRHGLH